MKRNAFECKEELNTFTWKKTNKRRRKIREYWHLCLCWPSCLNSILISNYIYTHNPTKKRWKWWKWYLHRILCDIRRMLAGVANFWHMTLLMQFASYRAHLSVISCTAWYFIRTMPQNVFIDFSPALSIFGRIQSSRLT